MGRLYVKQARNPKIWRTRHIEAASSCMIPIYPVPYFFQGKASFSISDLPQLVVCPSAITFCFFHIFSLQIQEPRHSLCRGSFLSLDVSLQNSSKISQKYFSVPSIRPSFFDLFLFWFLVGRTCPLSPALASKEITIFETVLPKIAHPFLLPVHFSPRFPTSFCTRVVCLRFVG